MKSKKSLSGYVILITLLVISVISIVFFGNKGASLVINLVFASLMFGILMYVMGNVRKYISLINALKGGAEYLVSLNQDEISNIRDGYSIFPSNEKLYRLITKYFKHGIPVF